MIKTSDEVESEVETAVVSVPGPRKTHPLPKWSNGWSWEGQPYKAKVFITVSLMFSVTPSSDLHNKEALVYKSLGIYSKLCTRMFHNHFCKCKKII